MKKILLVLVFLAIASFGAWFFIRQTSPAPISDATLITDTQTSTQAASSQQGYMCGLNLHNHLVRIEEIIPGGFKVVTAPWEWYEQDKPFPEVRFTVLINDQTEFCEGFTAQQLGPDGNYPHFLFRTNEELGGVSYPAFSEGSVVTAAVITIP